jgi:hypothetical protein
MIWSLFPVPEQGSPKTSFVADIERDELPIARLSTML